MRTKGIKVHFVFRVGCFFHLVLSKKNVLFSLILLSGTTNCCGETDSTAHMGRTRSAPHICCSEAFSCCNTEIPSGDAFPLKDESGSQPRCVCHNRETLKPPPPHYFLFGLVFGQKSNLKQKNSRNQQMGGKSDSFSNSNIMRFTEPLWNKPLMDFCELFCIKMKTLPWLPCSAVIGLFWCCLRQAPKGT